MALTVNNMNVNMNSYHLVVFALCVLSIYVSPVMSNSPKAIATRFGSSQSHSVCVHNCNNKTNSLHTKPHNGLRSTDMKSNSLADSGIYFSDIPQNDGEGSGSDDDDDLDENASGKGFDDEDSKDNIDKGSGDEPIDSDRDILDLGSGEEPLIISSTEKPTKKPESTKKPVSTVAKEKESRKKDPVHRMPTYDENVVPDNVPPVVTTETSTKFSPPYSSIRPKLNEFESDDNNKLNNEVSIMGQKQVTPASFFARPGILAAVIGGAVVGLLCAILLVMFIVYRMRKKDEGSYALDEPKRSTSSNPYAKSASKEFYA